MNNPKPIAYLDIDDTLIRWVRSGEDNQFGFHPIPAPGAREFLRKLKEHYEVRWLTYWCPDGIMTPARQMYLASILDMPITEIAEIEGADFDKFNGRLADKQDGIDWTAVAEGRGFIWIEDDEIVGHNLRERLKRHDLWHCYHECNVTKDPEALIALHEKLFGKEAEDGETFTSESRNPVGVQTSAPGDTCEV